jgi:hypothetical protein
VQPTKEARNDDANESTRRRPPTNDGDDRGSDDRRAPRGARC